MSDYILPMSDNVLPIRQDDWVDQILKAKNLELKNLPSTEQKILNVTMLYD